MQTRRDDRQRHRCGCGRIVIDNPLSDADPCDACTGHGVRSVRRRILDSAWDRHWATNPGTDYYRDFQRVLREAQVRWAMVDLTEVVDG